MVSLSAEPLAKPPLQVATAISERCRPVSSLASPSAAMISKVGAGRCWANGQPPPRQAPLRTNHGESLLENHLGPAHRVALRRKMRGERICIVKSVGANSHGKSCRYCRPLWEKCHPEPLATATLPKGCCPHSRVALLLAAFAPGGMSASTLVRTPRRAIRDHVCDSVRKWLT